ncbi:hypothetical protein [Paenibacillus gansuensis]|uniref:Transposase n=1 Tax=Paenibacillus gansuensis TaxID=306542 RepID=A0ABW5PMK1_9BACL
MNVIDDIVQARMDRLTPLINRFTELFAEKCGDWRYEERFPEEYREYVAIAQGFRRHPVKELAHFGYRLQSLMTEFNEMDRIGREKGTHVREARKQSALLLKTFEKIVKAFDKVIEKEGVEIEWPMI